MDISKASNFERFVFDMVGRDPAVVQRICGSEVERDGGLRSCGHAALGARGRLGIRLRHEHARRSHRDDPGSIHSATAIVIDPHTADGLKVGLQHREPGVPLICIETALPAKFAATISEALGRSPERPAGLERHRGVCRSAATCSRRRRRRSRPTSPSARAG